VQTQGFKIHLSATSKNAHQVLDSALATIVKYNLPFKCLIDHYITDVVNTQNYSRSGSGKFITVYPHNIEIFKEVIEELFQNTKHLSGPYILSDRPYKESKVVFYRYGSFKPMAKLEIDGFKRLYILNSDGAWIPEVRMPMFCLPEGVKDPFETESTKSENVTLKNVYSISGMIHISNKGGIYLASEKDSEKKLIVKEARPWVNQTVDFPNDAVATLNNEYRCLMRLESSGFTPRPKDFFQEWQHHFLVMEYIEGKTLAKLMVDPSFNLLLKDNPSDEDRIEYCGKFLEIGRQLLSGLESIHARGVVIRDLAPQNIIISDDYDKATFIDFEGAYILGDPNSIVVPVATIGFSTGNEKEPSYDGDYRAFTSLLCSLLIPNQRFFSINPSAKTRIIEAMLDEIGLPRLFKEITLSDSPEEVRLGFQKLETFLENPSFTPKIAELPLPLPQTTARNAMHITRSFGSSHPVRLFPCDYRVFSTNGLSLAYGALGTSLYLKRENGKLPREIGDELIKRCDNIDHYNYTPGLFLGISGIAYGLNELGYASKANALMVDAYASPLKGVNADVFHGDAGLGLVTLYFYRITKESNYLDQALSIAKSIEKLLEENEKGLFFRNFTGDVYHGIAYGSAGIALFFLNLYQITQDSRHEKIAVSLLDYEINHAIDMEHSLQWPRSEKKSKVMLPYLATGSSGIGIVLLRFFEELGEIRYLELAKRAAVHLKGKYCAAPSLFMGMAGLGHFFVELFKCTKDPIHLLEARQFAAKILHYRIEEGETIAFPGEDLLRICHDLATGSAGIGLFLHQLQNPEEAPLAGLI
jgi:serine/threonine protein kinase